MTQSSLEALEILGTSKSQALAGLPHREVKEAEVHPGGRVLCCLVCAAVERRLNLQGDVKIKAFQVGSTSFHFTDEEALEGPEQCLARKKRTCWQMD